MVTCIASCMEYGTSTCTRLKQSASGMASCPLNMKISAVTKKLRAAATALATAARRKADRSDLRRWSAITSLSPEWDARTIAIAKLIPEHSSVLEFGAGRLVLPKYLSPGCSYTPSDICDRGPGTVICDLNQRPLPVFARHDVAVFSGVLEYVNDVHEVIANVGRSCRMVISSYVTAPTGRGLLMRIKRRRAGWVNDFTSKQFVAVFGRAGFRLVEERHFSGFQWLYCFKRNHD
jgi:hypothetical protein